MQRSIYSLKRVFYYTFHESINRFAVTVVLCLYCIFSSMYSGRFCFIWCKCKIMFQWIRFHRASQSKKHGGWLLMILFFLTFEMIDEPHFYRDEGADLDQSADLDRYLVRILLFVTLHSFIRKGSTFYCLQTRNCSGISCG